ncbi:hypothetical protein AHAS_Ahas02G0161000 [Arachis hypogaea]
MGRPAGFSLGEHIHHIVQQHAPSVSSGGVSFSSINNQISDILTTFGFVLGKWTSWVGLRPLNSPNTVSSMGQYDQILQQYQ